MLSSLLVPWEAEQMAHLVQLSLCQLSILGIISVAVPQ